MTLAGKAIFCGVSFLPSFYKFVFENTQQIFGKMDQLISPFWVF